MPGGEQEHLYMQELLRAAAEQGVAGTLRGVQQGPPQENSEIQRLRLEVAQLCERVAALEKPEVYRGFVDLMSEKGGYP